MNGMNGGPLPSSAAGMAAPAPAPLPASHQAELSYIFNMVEELSRQLADNRRVTQNIISGLGKVRHRTRMQNLNNEELELAARDINGEIQSIDDLISRLSDALEEAKFSRDENARLLSLYASAFASMLKQLHEYKVRHATEVATWHRSYRAQLDEARQENCRLREHIWDMQTHASRANDSLRHLRRIYDNDSLQNRHSVETTALRQELRFWKRIAMPELYDDDPYWSADDDIIDIAEKVRQCVLEQRAAQDQLIDSHQEDGSESSLNPPPPSPPPAPHLSVLGGVASQSAPPGSAPSPAAPSASIKCDFEP